QIVERIGNMIDKAHALVHGELTCIVEHLKPSKACQRLAADPKEKRWVVRQEFAQPAGEPNKQLRSFEPSHRAATSHDDRISGNVQPSTYIGASRRKRREIQ